MKKTIKAGLVLLVGLLVMTGAYALLTSFGVITQTDTIDRSVIIGGGDCSDNVCTESTSAVGGETITTETYTITSLTSVNAPIDIVTTVSPDDGSVTIVEEYLQEAAYITYAEDGYVGEDFDAGRTQITYIFDTPVALGSLGDIIYDYYVISGYPSSINILLDTNNDGKFESKKDLTTGNLTDGVDDVLKIEWAHNGATAGYPDAYMLDEERNVWTTFTADGSVTAWLYSEAPGPGVTDCNHNTATLSTWISGRDRGTNCCEITDVWHTEACGSSVTVDTNTKVYGIQIETLGWIAQSTSKVRGVSINGVAQNIITLEPGESVKFDLAKTYDLGAEGEYTVTTNIVPQ